MIIIIPESTYRKRERRIRLIKRLLVAIPLAAVIASTCIALGFWWSH